jgi:hypothetical protein
MTREDVSGGFTTACAEPSASVDWEHGLCWLHEDPDLWFAEPIFASLTIFRSCARSSCHARWGDFSKRCPRCGTQTRTWAYDLTRRDGEHQIERGFLEREAANKAGRAAAKTMSAPGRLREAKRICFDCPIRLQCCRWATEFVRLNGARSLIGVWGGLDETDRSGHAKAKAA